VIAYSKRDGDDVVIVICSLDPDNQVESDVWLDFSALGLAGQTTVPLRDELTGATFTWGERNFVRLNPTQPAHILHVQTGA
jgi:starch synthase (maltosyl-transferring)